MWKWLRGSCLDLPVLIFPVIRKNTGFKLTSIKPEKSIQILQLYPRKRRLTRKDFYGFKMMSHGEVEWCCLYSMVVLEKKWIIMLGCKTWWRGVPIHHQGSETILQPREIIFRFCSMWVPDLEALPSRGIRKQLLISSIPLFVTCSAWGTVAVRCPFRKRGF